MEIVGTCSGFALDTLKPVRSKEVVESRLCIHEGTTTKQLLSLLQDERLAKTTRTKNYREKTYLLVWKTVRQCMIKSID